MSFIFGRPAPPPLAHMESKIKSEGQVKSFVFNQMLALLNEASLVGGKCNLDTEAVQDPIIEGVLEALMVSYINGIHAKYNGQCMHPREIYNMMNAAIAHAITDAYDICHLEEKDIDG